MRRSPDPTWEDRRARGRRIRFEEEYATALGLKTIVRPVKDPGPAKALFRPLLGVEPYVDEPYCTGFLTDTHEIGIDPHGHAQGMTGPVPHWIVTDLRRTLAALVEAGVTPLQDVQDVGGGTLVASVRDPDGNLVGLFQDVPA